MCCSECGLKCFETITDYLTTDALAYIAITGDGFCLGAWKGFMCSIKYSLEYKFALTVTGVYVFMLKFLIGVFNAFTGLFVMYDITGSAFSVKEHFVPIFLIFFVSWVIADLFLSIFTTVAQTLVMCLAVDMDLNDGKPEYGPVSFHEAMHTV